MKKSELDKWKDQNKALKEVKKRIRKILSESILESKCNPWGYCINEGHGFNFTISTKNGFIKGEVITRI